MDNSTTPQNINDDNRAVTEEEIANMSQDELMDAFVMQMLIDRGIANVEEPVLQKFHAEVKEQLIFEINRAILAALPEDKYEIVAKGLEEGSMEAEQINATIAESGVDVDAITEEVMLKFREVYLSAGNEQPAEGQEA